MHKTRVARLVPRPRGRPCARITCPKSVSRTWKKQKQFGKFHAVSPGSPWPPCGCSPRRQCLHCWIALEVLWKMPSCPRQPSPKRLSTPVRLTPLGKAYPGEPIKHTILEANISKASGQLLRRDCNVIERCSACICPTKKSWSWRTIIF